MFASFLNLATISVDSEITSLLGAVDVPAALEAIPRPSLIDRFLEFVLVDLATLNVSLIVSYINLASLRFQLYLMSQQHVVFEIHLKCLL